MINKFFIKYFWLLVVLIFSLFVSQLLFSNGFIVKGHDVIFHLMRIEGLKESLAGGQFPVQISGYAFNGYGEASGAFYPNLFFYIPVLMRFCGLSLAVSYNAFCVLINVATGLIAYWIFSKLFQSNKQGAAAAMIYVGFLYRLIDIYSRSAIGEAIAMAFIPLTLISMWLTLNRSVKYWSAVVIGFTGLMQSHVISTLIVISVVVIMMLRYYRLCIQNVKTIGKIAAFVTLLNIWFYVPFVNLYTQIDFYMKNVGMSLDILSNNIFVRKSAFFIQAFCGFFVLLIILIFIAKRLFDKFKHRPERFVVTPTFKFMLIAGSLITISMFTTSIWRLIEAIPYLGDKTRVIQFPMRFMALAAVALSYCAGAALSQMSKFVKYSRTFIIICCVIIAEANLLFLIFTPELHTTDRRGIGFYWNINFTALDEDMLKQIARVRYGDYLYTDIKISDLVYDAADNDMWQIGKVAKIATDDIQPAQFVSDFSKTGMKITFTARTNNPVNIKLPLFYYPGYVAYTIDGTELSLSDSGDIHRMQVEVPAGKTQVTVKYAGEPFWRVCDFISLVSLFVFIYLMFREKQLSGE